MHDIESAIRRGATAIQVQDMRQANAAEAEFLRSRGLRPYAWSPANLRAILASAGADAAAVQRVLDDHFGGGYASPGLFDHGLVLGRDGRPEMLVGHPYPAETARNLTPCAANPGLVAALADLGLECYVGAGHESFYGGGTGHVRVERRPDPERN